MDSEQSENKGSSDGAMAILQRIQERASNLAQEKEALVNAERLLDEEESAHTQQVKRSRKIRTEYLQTIVHQHSIEIECSNMEDLTCATMDKVLTRKKKKDEILENLIEEKDQWMASVEPELVGHRVRQELYGKHLNGIIDSRQTVSRRREDMLSTTLRLTKQLQQECDTLELQHEQVKSDIVSMNEQVHAENKQIEDLALKVRTAIEKRSELRASLREAQKVHQTAYDDSEKLASQYRNYVLPA